MERTSKHYLQFLQSYQFITVTDALMYIFYVCKYVNYAKPENVAPLKHSVFKSHHAVIQREADSFKIMATILYRVQSIT